MENNGKGWEDTGKRDKKKMDTEKREGNIINERGKPKRRYERRRRRRMTRRRRRGGRHRER